LDRNAERPPALRRNAMTESNPFELLRDIAGGYCLSRCLHTVAELGVADHLNDTPQTINYLAGKVGADPDALARVLRLLSAHGVFEVENEKVRHSAASRLLRSDHPQSMRSLARMFGVSINWAAFGAMEHSVRTGVPAAEHVLPGGFWAHYAEHPAEGAIFNAAMAAKAHGQVAGVIASYDFSDFGVIGDIGGGRGHLLRAVLDTAPAAKGVLFDLPHVIADAAAMASDRISLEAGDFFKDTLPNCDAYVLMEIIHDWSDDDAIEILKSIHRVAPPHSKLLLIEAIVPDDPGPHWSKMLDIHMLTLLGGRQRTLQEYESLFKNAGFAFRREIDTGADISIIEAVPV
jgi:O-methyltransferase domain